MEEDLDHILLDQLHSCKRNLKTMARLRKLFGNDPQLDEGEAQVYKKIVFFERMIEDKSILTKKPKRKSLKKNDVFARNPIYDAYKNSMMISYCSYKLFLYSINSYLSFFQPKKNKE